jgi:hypothetical protein
LPIGKLDLEQPDNRKQAVMRIGIGFRVGPIHVSQTLYRSPSRRHSGPVQPYKDSAGFKWAIGLIFTGFPVVLLLIIHEWLWASLVLVAYSSVVGFRIWVNGLRRRNTEHILEGVR